MTQTDPAEHASSLRERKKAQTRARIHRAALELAIARGPSTVTTDEIAERAGVSPRTFFNYFATKEEAYVGFTGDTQVNVVADLQARPAGESITDGVHAIFRLRFAGLMADIESWRLRRTLADNAPELANAMFATTARMERAVAAVAVQRAGSADMAVVVEAFKAMAAVRAALWAHSYANLEGDLLARLDDSFAVLQAEKSEAAAD